MKKLSFSIIVFVILLINISSFAQAPPEGINYQAVARDNSGKAISNSNLKIRFSIRDIAATGTIVFQEIHNGSTNVYGLFTLVIGNGLLVSTGSFSAINWGNGNKYLEVEVDTLNGNNYISMGITQMMSVINGSCTLTHIDSTGEKSSHRSPLTSFYAIQKTWSCSNGPSV